jgi:hypothetical protein
VLLESIKREKREKAAFARLLVELAVEGKELTRERGALLLIQYEEELHQFKYNYKYVPVEQRLKMVQTGAHDEDIAILDKVSGMTVSDEDAGRDD